MEYLVQAKVTTSEGGAAGCGFYCAGTLGCHLLSCFVLVPLFPFSLPSDESIDLRDRHVLVYLAHVHSALEESVHVELPALRTVSQEFEDALQPAHQLLKEAVVVDVYFVNEFVKIVLMALAKVNEGLDGLVGVGRYVLALCFFYYREHVVGEDGEVCDAVVDVGRFVDAD